MKVSETPLKIGKLTAAKELQGGNKGAVFLLAEGGQRIVLKFQKEDPVEPLAGTRILKAAGASTPTIRRAAAEEVAGIKAAVDKLKDATDVQKRLNHAADVFPYAVLMDYVEAKELAEKRDGELADFVEVLRDSNFAYEMGKIAAADTFGGNPDRFFAGRLGSPEIQGWYHEKNTLVSKDRKPIAIDNAFAPGLRSKELQKDEWGRHLPGTGLQFGSLAAADETLSKKEGGLIFDRLLSTVLKRHADSTDKRVKKLVAKAQASRENFATKYAEGAKFAMDKLLTRGQSWKKQFAEDGSSAELLKAFKTRKRTLRLIAAGQDAASARMTAEDDTRYREWVLTSELRCSDKIAERILEEGIESYKAEKKFARPMGELVDLP